MSKERLTMKRLLHGLWMAALVLCCNLQAVLAQQMPAIPVDQNVRIGKLENGLTYYIRRNTLPENRADFYIAQKVGSIQEEANQRGLAHFLEHMCFNGTTHFPGDGLKQYLERIGVKFGENLNAYTSVDETVYNICNVPVTTAGAIDSCLLILHDWSNDLTLDPVEIDKERGVINEEWRSRMGATMRLQEKMMPIIYPGSKYATSFVIGTMDVVMNFPPQTLREYYEKWYRPDLQGIVVVGDIDVDEIEAKIKSVFADIPAQPDAAKREYFPVGNNEEPIFVVLQDKELPNIQALVFNKHEAVPDAEKGNLGYLVQNYAIDLINQILNARLSELMQTANPPFVVAQTYDSNFFVAKTMDAFTGISICKEDDILGGFKALLREMERARKFGFTETEYNRARAEYLRQLESAYNERDKRKNEQFVSEYVRHFLDNEPIPGIEAEYTLMNQIAPNIPVAVLNQAIQQLVKDNNQVIAVFGPEKEGIKMPTEAELKQVLAEVKAEELTAYEDKVSNEPLMAAAPEGGKIVAESTDARFGTTHLTLGNGVKVIIKQTDFKADEIRMMGTSFGGSSLFPDSEIVNIKALEAVGVGGLGNFSAVDLEKALAGKKASVSYQIEQQTENVIGNCSPKDFETMLQLTYLTFTAPRRDDEAFASYKNRTKAALQNQDLNPMVSFSDSVSKAVFEGHPRSLRLKADMVDQIDYDKLLSMYRDRYMDASDFTFIFVGNVDIEQMKPLIAAYLGTLPATHRTETFADNRQYIRKGEFKNVFERKQENPKATTIVAVTGDCAYNLKNQLMMSMTGQILDLVYTEKVREDEGGTYGVYPYGRIDKHPKEEAVLQIIFETSPSKREKLMKIIFGELSNLGQTGPKQADLDKVKEYMLKKHAEDLKENSYWLSSIERQIVTGVDAITDFEQTLDGITTEDIRQFVAALAAQKNEIEVSMISPE